MVCRVTSTKTAAEQQQPAAATAVNKRGQLMSES